MLEKITRKRFKNIINSSDNNGRVASGTHQSEGTSTSTPPEATDFDKIPLIHRLQFPPRFFLLL